MATLDIDEMRQTLARVSIYRQVCETVRASAGHTLFNGVFFLGLAALYYNIIGGFHFLLIGPLVIGSLEILVGLWKRIKPSPECVLFDGLLQFGFVGWIVIRELMSMQALPGRKPSMLTIGIGLWIAYDAFHTLMHYFQLRQIFVERPTSEHLAYVDDLKAEIAASEPEQDSSIIVLPTRPYLKAKLLGDIAIFFDEHSSEIFLCARDEMELRRVSSGGVQKVELTILRESYPPCEIDSASWSNYANWKTEGGERIPPATVRPNRD